MTIWNFEKFIRLLFFKLKFTNKFKFSTNNHDTNKICKDFTKTFFQCSIHLTWIGARKENCSMQYKQMLPIHVDNGVWIKISIHSSIDVVPSVSVPFQNKYIHFSFIGIDSHDRKILIDFCIETVTYTVLKLTRISGLSHNFKWNYYLSAG